MTPALLASSPLTAGDDLLLAGRTVAALVVVLAVVALAARLARRAGAGRRAASLRVLERTGLSRDAALAVVAAGDRTLLLGVTAGQVSLLADLTVDPTATVEWAPVAIPEQPAAELPTRTPGDALAAAGGRRAGSGGGRHARPEPKPAPPMAMPATGPTGSPTRDLLAGLDLDRYPDLATALRAAGRTVAARAAAAAPAATPASTQRARTAGKPPARIPQPRDPQQQASGSVLSPRTWRQGLDALRDRTARRG